MSSPVRQLLRPKEWPAGHRAAVAVIVDLEPSGTATGSSPHFLAAGAERLLTMLTDLDIAPTVAVDPSSGNTNRLSREIDVDPAVVLRTDGSSLDDVIRTCEERVGRAPKGIIVDNPEQGDGTDKRELWVVDGTASPFPLRNAGGSVVIPSNPWWRDSTWLAVPHPAPPSAMLEHWSVSLASVRTYGELMTIQLSAEIGGQPGHVETIQRFLDESIGAGDVWITNFSGVAEVVQSIDRT